MSAALRIGQGFDVHPFADGRSLWLGGVQIPHTRGLLGHSDADPLLHALTDAILGAVGRGDIGQRFPNTDPQWKGASSLEMLRIVWDEVRRDSWEIVNCDTVVLAERPKIAPHVPLMKDRIAGVLGVAADRVGIKATTTEKLGAVGREEGIAAFATVLLARAGAQ